MEYECTLRELAPQPVMSIRGTVRPDQLVASIGEFLGEVWQHIEQGGGQPVGPPFTRYHAIGEDSIELEGGMPVAQPLAPAGRVSAGELPGGPAVATIHIGPYEELPAAGAALDAWAAANGRLGAGPAWEIYLTDPGTDPDPATWKTELIKPLQPLA